MKQLLVLLVFATSVLFADDRPFDDPFPVKKEIVAKVKVPEDRGTIGTSAWWSLKLFQIFISPQDGPNCMYSPTCSRFAIISVYRYGPIVGTMMAADRLLRCNPFGYAGYDPPEDNFFPLRKASASSRGSSDGSSGHRH
jgi:putative membrane protein insertion efficiency factor